MPVSKEVDSTDNLVFTTLWAVGLVLTDLIIYGFLFPILGVYFAGSIAVAWALNPFHEILLVILSVFAIIFFTFYVHLETRFWTHLFSQEIGFLSILQIRDIVNLIILACSFSSVFYSINDMINDHEIKSGNLSEGMGYIVLKPLVNGGIISESWLDSCQCQINFVGLESADQQQSNVIYDFVLKWVVYLELFQNPVPLPTNADCVKDKFVHGAQFVFAVACLTASIIKVIYFNTLYAYLRAMNIFISMLPDEDDDDDDDMDEDDEDYDGESSMTAKAKEGLCEMLDKMYRL